jgi:hypothetical protein
MTPDELKTKIDLHAKWLRGEEGGVRLDLRWANLTEADLTEANLSGADLYGANLYKADLRWANLYGANLRGANLYGADLRGANLYRANLTEADLTEANLYRANLTEANLYKADLTGADLTEAKGIFIIGPSGSRGDFLYAVINDSCVMIKAGCFWGTLDEFSAAVDKTHGDNKHGCIYRAATEMIKVWETEQRS